MVSITEEFAVSKGQTMKKMDRSGSRQGKGVVHKIGSIMRSLPSRTQVFLNEWWLVNANGKGLAIGGFAHRDERVSLFCSAPIVKRHDTTTFETADGMTIMVGGLINRLRTLENGFSSKVCNKFLLGFPYDWAEYSTSCYGEDSSIQAGSVKATVSEETDSQSRSTTNYFEATSLDDVTVPKLRDLFSLGDLDDSFLMEKIYDDVVGMLGSSAEHDGEFLRSSRKNSLGMAAKSQFNEAQIKKKKSSEDGLCKHNEDILSARKTVKKVNHKSGRQLRALRRRREGVSTRSMTKLKK
ncbi:kinetochore-associated protein KNL-2 homolog isoform X2 [Rhodamnia argentea]|uniref:Kinetochore-associated protein KNL-2 homolog isoform X2 n=1 Tax=Rhodamnia argentea TaxID=178133 RepID=A0ABM3GV44_9MYRT|nr:kinetochore-associated protein KNL-2 homolog isoform X2 [Rhodamnia argentea]